MRSRLLRFVVRRVATAAALVALVSSAGLLLARLAPGDHLTAFDLDPAVVSAERQRLCLDCPLYQQYFAWLTRVAHLDLGESTMYPGRAVGELIAERAPRSAILGAAALVVATVLGIPLGVLSGSRTSGVVASAAEVSSSVLLAVPPIVLSLLLLLMASRTGWFPVGGLPGDDLTSMARYLVLPVVALALPLIAVLERLQSRALTRALADPSIVAARARGVPRARLLWRHAFRLSLPPVLAVYGVIVGTLLSGSFVVEYVMTWPGLGRLMYDALVYRDANLVAACAATGTLFLALAIVASDLLLAVVDPRQGDLV